MTLHRPPLALIFSITLTGILANTLIPPALPDILDYFGEPDSAAGLLLAAATLPGIVMAPVIGVLADRYGRRHVLVPCLAVFGVFGLAAGLATSFEMLVLFRFVQGIGSAGLINLAVVLIGDHWEGVERTRLIGFNAAVLTISVAIVPGLSGVLDEVGGWRWSFAPYGLALLTALAALRFVPDGRPADPPHLVAQIKHSLSLLRKPVLGGSIGLGFVVFAMIFGLMLTVLPLMLERDFGFEPSRRGLFLALPAIGSTTAALSLGRSRRRLGARLLLALASVALAVGFGLVSLAVSLGLIALIGLGALVYGLGEGTSIPMAQDLVAGEAPPEARGAMVALWVGAARAGQTTGPLLAAALFVPLGSATLFAGGAVICGLLGAAIVASPKRWYP